MAEVGPSNPAGTWHVDFEFPTNPDGTARTPYLMAAHHHHTGRMIVLWGDELTAMARPPFPVGPSTFVVCHHCPAEARCFELLKWPRPNFIDTLAEFRLSAAYADIREESARREKFAAAFKGLPKRQHVFRLNHVARALGVAPLYDDAEKDVLQKLGSLGPPSDEHSKRRMTDYCIGDTLMTRQCLPRLIVPGWSPAAAAIRADFVLLCERMKGQGIPVWAEGLRDLLDHREALRERVIAEWDRFGVFRGGSFSNRAFLALLETLGMPWPYLEGSGGPDLRKETFREQGRIHPVIGEIGRLRDTVAMFKSISLEVGGDDRTRTDLWPLASKTSRCQPSGSRCLFLLPKFMRKFMVPPPGLAIIQGDYSQQEVLVAGCLSDDEAICRAYRDGDCYIGLAKELGLVPSWASEKTHPAERKKCKSLLLGLMFRMSAEGLASRLKMSHPEARALHARLRRTFSTYFAWGDAVIAMTRKGSPVTTAFGWTLQPRYFADNSRTRVNFLIQATAADIMRAAALLADSRGLELIMTVHDSLIIQCRDDEVPEASEALLHAMQDAAEIVLGPAGAAMRIDLDTALSGRSLTLDDADEAKYEDVLRWLAAAKRVT
jgi:hypothetical protein